MDVYKLEETEEEVTMLSSEEAGTQQGGSVPGVRAAKSSEFRQEE